jgi:hypothetical protein
MILVIAIGIFLVYFITFLWMYSNGSNDCYKIWGTKYFEIRDRVKKFDKKFERKKK